MSSEPKGTAVTPPEFSSDQDPLPNHEAMPVLSTNEVVVVVRLGKAGIVETAGMDVVMGGIERSGTAALLRSSIPAAWS